MGPKMQLTNNGGFQINKDGSRNMFARSCFTEESVEGVITTSYGLVAGHLTIRLDAVLQAVQLPTGVADLHASLTNMNTDTFTLKHNN